MEYYHNIITQKSWQELIALRKEVDFVLIGGWAIYLYTKQLKSKDIDIMIDYDQLPVLEKKYVLTKNERLKKYQAQKEEIEIDLYLPHFSTIGLPVETLIQQAKNQKGFQVLEEHYLFVLKVFVLSQRANTPKGRKDLLDVVGLAVARDLDWQKIKTIIKEFDLDEALNNFLALLKQETEMPELNLNQYKLSRLKKEITNGLEL